MGGSGYFLSLHDLQVNGSANKSAACRQAAPVLFTF
jgi:hypothetical protein